VANEIRGLFSQGIEILGFKPLSHLQDYHNVSVGVLLIWFYVAGGYHAFLAKRV
jgi:hypothetical protein